MMYNVSWYAKISHVINLLVVVGNSVVVITVEAVAEDEGKTQV